MFMHVLAFGVNQGHKHEAHNRGIDAITIFKECLWHMPHKTTRWVQIDQEDEDYAIKN